MLNEKYVLAQINLHDLAGVGEKVRQAINKYSDNWLCYNIVHKRHVNHYPIDCLVHPKNYRRIRTILENADVIQFNHSEKFSKILNINIPKNVIKSVIHTGSRYRRQFERMNGRFSDMNIVFVGRSMIHLNPNALPFIAPIDTERYKPIKKPDDYNLCVVGHSPSHRKRKGTKYLLRALSRFVRKRRSYPQLRLKLIESVSYKKAMIEKAKCDIFVDNLSREYSAFGQSALEAACFGIPILTGRKNFSDETCPFIDVNGDNILRRLKELIINKNLRLQMGKRTRKWIVDNCSYKVVAKYLTDTYEEKLK